MTSILYNDAMQAITYSEARNNLVTHLDRIVNDCDITVITRQKAEPAVLMCLREYEFGLGPCTCCAAQTRRAC